MSADKPNVFINRILDYEATRLRLILGYSVTRLPSVNDNSPALWSNLPDETESWIVSTSADVRLFHQYRH